MKRFTIYALLFVVGLFFFSSCNSKVSEAEELGSKFYNALMQSRYDDILPMLDDHLLNKQSFSQLKSIFSSIVTQRGFIQSFRPANVRMFHDEYDNLYIKIKYNVNYTTGSFPETLTFVLHKGRNRFKILNYDY